MKIRYLLALLLVAGASAGAVAADRSLSANEQCGGVVSTHDYENMSQEEIDRLFVE